MTIAGGNSSIQKPTMNEKNEKVEGKLQQIAKEVSKEGNVVNELPKKGKDTIESNLKCGKAEKCVEFFEPAKSFPAGFVESIRNSEGINRDEKLINFQKKIDNMPEKDLKVLRDYLVKEMANPKNDDDPLLGALLNAVNRELDSRENNIFIKLNPFPPKPMPIDPMPFPPGGCFPKPLNELDDFVKPLNKQID